MNLLAKLKLYLLIAGITLALGMLTNGFTAWKFWNMGDTHGRATVQAEWDKAKSRNINQKLETKVKQDEIKNAPLDNDVTDRRLLHASF